MSTLKTRAVIPLFVNTYSYLFSSSKHKHTCSVATVARIASAEAQLSHAEYITTGLRWYRNWGITPLAHCVNIAIDVTPTS